MTTSPRLTVGLPVYNGQKYVAESIEALLGQTFTDFELIISDNASTDETGDICRGYEKQDPRVRYFRQPRNVGLAPNHNFVAEQAGFSVVQAAEIISRTEPEQAIALAQQIVADPENADALDKVSSTMARAGVAGQSPGLLRLQQLREDADLRAQMGAAGRAAMEELFSPAARQEVLKFYVRGLAGSADTLVGKAS